MKPNEQDVLVFIGEFERKFHQPPTMEDVAIFVGIKEARRCIRDLVRQGYIERGLIHEQKIKTTATKKTRAR